MTGPEKKFLWTWKAVAGLAPAPVQEYRFDPVRLWKMDFAWPKQRVAVEIEGGTWKNGRHSRGLGFERDCDKYNHATFAGWRVLRLSTGMITSENVERIVRFVNERR